MTREQAEAMAPEALDHYLAELIYFMNSDGLRVRDGYLWRYLDETLDPHGPFHAPEWEKVGPIPAYSRTWEGMESVVEWLESVRHGVSLMRSDGESEVHLQRLPALYQPDRYKAGYSLPRLLAVAVASSFTVILDRK